MRFGKFIGKRIGRRNLPFLAVVSALMLVIILLLVLSPAMYSERSGRAPTVVSSE
jgi:hypothetical protein